jgi:hypothetical protein
MVEARLGSGGRIQFCVTAKLPNLAGNLLPLIANGFLNLTGKIARDADSVVAGSVIAGRLTTGDFDNEDVCKIGNGEFAIFVLASPGGGEGGLLAARRATAVFQSQDR